MPSQTFQAFFGEATGKTPYPYQVSLATAPIESRLIDVPTGCGKTAAVILGWLWQRRVNPTQTPRRLVYCLPMRVLVEQTHKNAEGWLKELGLDERVRVYVLMGGEDTEDWDLYPEREAILVGTQDMLLSRALNRGYGMSRYRWPMHFGLLHADCLWVFDEIQLMGSGLATTAQLAAFRADPTGDGCYSFWMSATLHRTWLETVDFRDKAKSLPLVKLEKEDLAARELRGGYEAKKPLDMTKATMGDCEGLAQEIIEAHTKAKGRTLVVVNTVGRARELHGVVQRALRKAKVPITPVLIHSQFRPPDRNRQMKRLLAEPDEDGMLVISTQVVEAGVDVSAHTLFTELAPWSSLVQRFGRCNRRGRENETARVCWIDLPSKKEEQENLGHPYELEDLLAARKLLRDLDEVGPKSLEGVPHEQASDHKWVIRRKDFTDLFDTTPDLAGNDIDIDRYVREVEESDVQVFWRGWKGESPAEMPRPTRDELCRVPTGEFKRFLDDLKRRELAHRWDYLNDEWVRVGTFRVYPGQIYLLNASTGGYATDLGWNSTSTLPVAPVLLGASQEAEAYDGEGLSQSDWQSIAQHTDKVCAELDSILGKLPLEQCESNALRIAARWHDRGKAHDSFLAKLRPEALAGARTARFDGDFPAKAPKVAWVRGQNKNSNYRKHFRHELASALSVLMAGEKQIADDVRDLVAYLVAAHHGKVRLSIRSLPEEQVAPNGRRFARGVWDDDELPASDLGGGVMAPSVKLLLEPMELGLCEKKPFAGQPSWAERMLRLRDKLGTLRVAYLEALLRAADMRASGMNNA